jgi:hypothetical protein
MARIYANRIWAKDYDYNSTKKAYLKLKEKVTAIMREDVADGKYTTDYYTEITGLEY